jgi:transposase-like protein
MQKCPNCQATTRQNKAGKTDAGSQRYRCMHCQRKYTPNPKHHGYPVSLRKRAAEMYVDGGNLRRIARHLKVSPQTVSLWVTDVAEALPNAPVPQESKKPRWMKSSLLSVTKKQNLHSDRGRPQNQMYFRLGGGLGSYPSSHSGRG